MVWTSAGLQKEPDDRKVIGLLLFVIKAAPTTFNEESRRVLSGDVNHDKTMKSCRYDRARFGPVADQPSRLRTPPGVGSAIINIKEPNNQAYSPGHSLIKDLSDGWIPGPYQNIFPSIAVFEVSATVSRMHRDGKSILREFYLMDENSILYNVDEALISRSYDLFTK